MSTLGESTLTWILNTSNDAMYSFVLRPERFLSHWVLVVSGKVLMRHHGQASTIHESAQGGVLKEIRYSMCALIPIVIWDLEAPSRLLV